MLVATSQGSNPIWKDVAPDKQQGKFPVTSIHNSPTINTPTSPTVSSNPQYFTNPDRVDDQGLEEANTPNKSSTVEDPTFSYREVSELSDATEDVQAESLEGDDDLEGLNDYDMLLQATSKKMQILSEGDDMSHMSS